MGKDIKLAVCYFFPEEQYLDYEYCMPIQLGFEETHLELGIQKDSEGDHRSEKHPIYSEFSGVYWLWKNTVAEYKGMFHHRRFVTAESVPPGNIVKDKVRLAFNWAKNLIWHRPYTYNKKIVCHNETEYRSKVQRFLNELPHILDNEYDIVLPARFHYYRGTVGEAFDEVVDRYTHKLLLEVFKQSYPDYLHYFQATWGGTTLFYSNCEVMKNYVFDRYCTFVFGVFDELERKLVEEGYYIDPLKEKSLYRSFGYIAELLMNSFVHKFLDEGGKVKELPLLFNASAKGNENIDWKNMVYK